jgi:hypothetical protein
MDGVWRKQEEEETIMRFYATAWSVSIRVGDGLRQIVGAGTAIASNNAEAEGMMAQWLRDNYPADSGYFNPIISVNDSGIYARAYAAKYPEETTP